VCAGESRVYYLLEEVLLPETRYRGGRAKEKGAFKGYESANPRPSSFFQLIDIIGAAENDEEIRWDEDSDSDDALTPHDANSSQTTLKQPKSREQSASGQKDSSETATLKPVEPRKSNDQHSQTGSDASYDIVSGASSRAPGSPKEAKKEDDSDEDWE